MNNPISEKLKPPSSSEKTKPLPEGHFTEEKIGWTIKLPGGDWSVVTKKEKEKRSKKTIREIEESTGVKVDVSRIEQLISFNNNRRSSFTASIEPFDESQFGGYDNNLALQREILKQTYAAKNVHAKYEIGASRIGGVMIDWFIARISAPGKKKDFTIRIYNCLRNNYFFTIVIGYDNVEDEKKLLNVVYSSKFTEEVK